MCQGTPGTATQSNEEFVFVSLSNCVLHDLKTVHTAPPTMPPLRYIHSISARMGRCILHIHSLLVLPPCTCMSSRTLPQFRALSIIQYSIFCIYVYLLVCIMCFFPFSLLSNMGHAYGELATSFFAAFDFGFGFFFGESSRLAILSRFCEK